MEGGGGNFHSYDKHGRNATSATAGGTARHGVHAHVPALVGQVFVVEPHVTAHAAARVAVVAPSTRVRQLLVFLLAVDALAGAAAGGGCR